MALTKSSSGTWLLAILFGAILLELVLLAPAYLNKPEETVPVSKAATTQSAETASGPLSEQFAQSMKGVHVVETKNDKREWELWSDVASTFKATGNLALEIVKTKFFGNNEVFFLVSGQKGAVVSETKDMFISGGVETNSSNGYQFVTEEIRYDSKERKLIADSSVVITGPAKKVSERLFLTGDSLRADLHASTIHVLGNVKAKKDIDLKGPKLLHISAGEALMSAENNEVSFSGGVFINLQGMKISGPTAKFLYKPGTQQISALELDGGVRVSDQDKWATSEKVRVDLDKDLYVLKGAPKVVQENDELFGDEIIFEDGGKKVKVKNARVKVSREHLEE